MEDRQGAVASSSPALVMLVSALVLAMLAAALLAARAPAAGTTATVKVAKTKLGSILVNGQGRTLYMFAADKRGKSVCYGSCAHYWPPLLTTGKPVAGKGAKASLLGTTKRKDGKLQVTYNGRPLYRYVSDTSAGQTSGQGLNLSGGLWWVMTPAGTIDKKKAATTGGGGYG